MNQQKEQQDQPSLDRLANQTYEDISQAVKTTDGLSTEAYQDKKRNHQDIANEHWSTRIKPKLHVILLTAVIFCTFIFFVLSTTYVLSILEVIPPRPGVEAFLEKMFDVVLISGATLYLESFYEKD